MCVCVCPTVVPTVKSLLLLQKKVMQNCCNRRVSGAQNASIMHWEAYSDPDPIEGNVEKGKAEDEGREKKVNREGRNKG